MKNEQDLITTTSSSGKENIPNSAEFELSRQIQNLEGRLIGLANQVVDQARQINPELDLSHQNLEDLFSLTREFFGASRVVTDYLKDEAQQVSASLSDIEGYSGTVGLGYPFYAIDRDGEPVDVPEISSFLDTTRVLIAEDKKLHPEGWQCPACQLVNKLPDLKTKCKPCDLVKIKPREVFRSLPDLDVVVIIDSPNEETEGEVKRRINELGYIQSDIDINGALGRTRDMLTSLKEGNVPEQKLPVDIHIWSKEAVKQSLDMIGNGEVKTTILGRSLHMDWENNPINFWFDFVFSMTEIDMKDAELAVKIVETRKKIKKRYSIDQIIEFTGQSSVRAKRLIDTESVKETLKAKIESW